MKGEHAAALALFIALGACDSAPPADLLHVPDAALRATRPVLDAGSSPWHSAYCNALPEPELTASFSDFKMTGECNLHQTAPAKCVPRDDDFYILGVRPLEGGRSLSFYVNVEKFKGPGDYTRTAEILVLVKDGPTLYQWVHYSGSVTLGTADRGGSSGWFKTGATKQPVTFAVMEPTLLYSLPGTLTNGTSITLEGTIACAPPDGSNSDFDPLLP